MSRILANLPEFPPKLDEGERWFVVHSLPKKELFARDNLELQGFRCYMPTVKKTVRHARKVSTVRAPFFPRYFFTILDLERDRWRSVNGTIGVGGLIMEDIRPKPVPDGVVESLIEITDELGLLSFERDLMIGDTVKILNGPLSGTFGELVKLNEKGRVSVLLSIMGGQREVTMQSDSIAPIS